MYSPLAYQIVPMSYTHYTNRTKRVDAVVIHYTASIVREARNTVNYWENSNPYTSANYIIDVTGRVTGVVPEERRPYTSSSWGMGDRDIDNHAVTIECSCDYIPENINDQAKYTESPDTLDACSQLLADIAERWGISKWIFVDDPASKVGNVHAHRWYANTPCPGDYLYHRLPEIAFNANKIMESKSPMTAEERKEFDELEAKVDKLAESVDLLTTVINTHTAVRYNSLDDVPEWGRADISWMLSKGYIKGTDAGLQMNYDMLRENVINARAFEEIDKNLTEIKKILETMAKQGESPFGIN